jgi:hypothetical protein
MNLLCKLLKFLSRYTPWQGKLAYRSDRPVEPVGGWQQTPVLAQNLIYLRDHVDRHQRNQSEKSAKKDYCFEPPIASAVTTLPRSSGWSSLRPN